MVEGAGVLESSSGRSRGLKAPGSSREGDQEPRLLDPSVRRQGVRSLAQWGQS